MIFISSLHGKESSPAVQTPGLQEPVERLTDRWGVPHIYAKNQELGPIPRGGDGYTVNNTDNAALQLTGASFRIIADLADWDCSVGVNTPSQSGNSADPHYRDLAELWANGKHCPVLYPREKVEGVTEKKEGLLHKTGAKRRKGK